MAKFSTLKTVLSFIIIVLLLIVIIPVCLAFLVFKLITSLLGLLLAGLAQVALSLFVKYIYVSRIGVLHALHSKWIQKEPHSRSGRTDVISSNGYSVSVHSLPCLTDNYAYLIVNRGLSQRQETSCPDLSRLSPTASLLVHQGTTSQQSVSLLGQTTHVSETSSHLSPAESSEKMAPLHAVLVDVGDGDMVLKSLATLSKLHYSGRSIQIDAILTTHHHWDHQYGNRKLLTAIPNLKIYGGWRDQVDCCTHTVTHNQILSVGEGVLIEVMETPCHTHGSVIYRLKCAHGDDCLFTGDTLFLGGCGAPFEQKRETMFRNFWQIERHCSPSSLVFPGHEYTKRMLTDLFHSSDCPTNVSDLFALCSALCRATHLRGLPVPAPTVPYKLAEEFKYNPSFKAARQNASMLRRAWRIKSKLLTSYDTQNVNDHSIISKADPSQNMTCSIEPKDLEGVVESKQHFQRSTELTTAFEASFNVEMSDHVNSEKVDAYDSELLDPRPELNDVIKPESSEVRTVVDQTDTMDGGCIKRLNFEVERSLDKLETKSNGLTVGDCASATTLRCLFEPLHDVQFKNRMKALLSLDSDLLGTHQVPSRILFQRCALTGAEPLLPIAQIESKKIISDYQPMSTVDTTSPTLQQASAKSAVQVYSQKQRRRSTSPTDPKLVMEAEELGDQLGAAKFQAHTVAIGESLNSHNSPLGTSCHVEADVLKSRRGQRQHIYFEPPWITSSADCGSPFIVLWRQELRELEHILKWSPNHIGCSIAIDRLHNYLLDNHLNQSRFSKSLFGEFHPLPREGYSGHCTRLSPTTRHPQCHNTRSMYDVSIVTQSSPNLSANNSNAYLTSEEAACHPETVCNDSNANSECEMKPSTRQSKLSPHTPPQKRSNNRQKSKDCDNTFSKKQLDHELPSYKKLVEALKLIVSPDQFACVAVRSPTQRSSQYGYETACWKIPEVTSIYKDDFIVLLTTPGRNSLKMVEAIECWHYLTNQFIRLKPDILTRYPEQASIDCAPFLPLQFIAESLSAPHTSALIKLWMSIKKFFVIDSYRGGGENEAAVATSPLFQSTENIMSGAVVHTEITNDQDIIKSLKKKRSGKTTRVKNVVVNEFIPAGHNFTRCRICQARSLH